MTSRQWNIATLILIVVCHNIWADDVNAARYDRAISFTRDVVPALTKVGCNGGTCHGSFQGRGGFRLSLLGFDPQADFDALARESRGRRISAAAPLESLILRKPSGKVAHSGGVVLETNSEPYRILCKWIENGMTGPGADDPVIERIFVSPTEIVMRPRQEATLKVQAVWSDGVKRDVTRWALFDIASQSIGEVSRDGTVSAVRCGRTFVTVRYSGQVAAVTVTVPYDTRDIESETPRNNFIDDHVVAEWKKVGVRPTTLCDDATFLRRVSVDLTGTLPSPVAIHDFCRSVDPQKRPKLINSLLDQPNFVDFWSLRWSDMLRGHRRFLGEKGLASFQSWLRKQIRSNAPADQIVRQLITAQGNLYTNGAVALYFVDKTPTDLAESTAQIFLGVRMQCARCHHHPFETWSQEEYYGLAAFFAKVKRKDTLESGRFGGAQAVLIGESGSVINPQTRQTVAPRVLGGQPLQLDDQSDAREILAKWITDRDNPFFAKNIVNRYWGFLFGRGLVHPIDDLRNTNPAVQPKLLDALARDFTDHGYDLKHLLRTICDSHVYQLAAEIAPTRDEDGTFLTHHVPRRLPAEVLLDAVNHVAGVNESFPNLPAGMRAIELPDSDVTSEFLDVFGRSKRTTTCECERGRQPDLRQALHLTNSDLLHQKITAKNGRIAKLLAGGHDDAEIIEELYLATLCRRPVAEELELAREFVAEGPSRKEVFEDLLWTLINCAEFSFTR